MITVFYGNQVWDEYLSWRLIDRDDTIPTGVYAYDAYNQKWWQRTHSWLVIEPNEVPAMCKAWMLILGS